MAKLNTALISLKEISHAQVRSLHERVKLTRPLSLLHNPLKFAQGPYLNAFVRGISIFLLFVGGFEFLLTLKGRDASIRLLSSSAMVLLLRLNWPGKELYYRRAS